MQRARFQRQAQKPYYTLTLSILEPVRFAGQGISSRIYCTRKGLWKLNWFLRDFGYDSELLGRDEVDERQLVGLNGVVKISPIVIKVLLCSASTDSHPPAVGKNFPLQSWMTRRGPNDL